MQIIRITYGETTLPESVIFVGGDENKQVPIILSVFVVKTPDATILVDAGCEDLPGFELTNMQSPVKVLQQQGINPEDITDVIITHVHHDHVQCVKYFPNARIWVQEQEYERGSRYFENNTHVITFREEATVANKVRAVKIGGHTTGSCVVECEKDGKTYVLCGDECYRRYNLQNCVPTAGSKFPENSRAFVEKYTREGYVCLLCHEA